MKRRTIYALAGSAAAAITLLLFTPLLIVDPSLPKINMQLSEVTNSEQDQTLSVLFTIRNDDDRTFRLAEMSYQLFANNKSLGNSTLSYEDAAHAGSAIVPNRTFNIKDQFEIACNEQANSEICSGALDTVKWSVEGTVRLETKDIVYLYNFTDAI